MSDTSPQLTLAAFQEYLNSEFVVMLQDDDGTLIPYPLTLVEAVALGDRDRDVAALGRESFSLVFSNPDTSRYLHQATYTLQHDAFSELVLFLVPLGPREGSMAYEVVIT